NSYSRQLVAAVSAASSVPAMMISYRSRVMLPNAPYVFTRCSGSKLAFIICRDDRRFVTGAMLSNPTRTATTYVAMRYAGGDDAATAGGRAGSHASHRSLTSG